MTGSTESNAEKRPPTLLPPAVLEELLGRLNVSWGSLRALSFEADSGKLTVTRTRLNDSGFRQQDGWGGHTTESFEVMIG